MPHSRRRRHARYSKRNHTIKVVFEISAIIGIVSLIVHTFSLSPCGQSNPITWVAYLFSPEDVAAKCAASLLRDKVITSNQARSAISSISHITGVDVDQTKYNRLVSQYQSYIPKSGKVTIDDLKKLPSEAKSLCDSHCKMLVKKYLKENNGQISVSKIRSQLDD